MDFQDRPLQCLDCKNEFIFTAGEQEFYERKGFKEIPKRCKPCRDARKTRRGDSGAHANGNGNGYGNGAGGNGYGNGEPSGNRPPRGDREMFDATCAACGAPARVPFRPAAGRPVYCRDCYTSRQGQGSGYGGGY
ncbi:MAG TPA: zinc-ribbon domain containing protein [Polyangia bacterium]|jgi:CxxC-x17-CxxC domain-containing protein|nr:zinc-ribbon domain containing protein [Polyangia bacterium]